MIAQVRKCLAFLSPRLRWRWAALIPVAIVAALMETLGAAAVFFLIKVVSDPASVYETPVLSFVFARLPWRGDRAVVQVLTVLVGLFYLFKNGLLAVFSYAQRKVVSESQITLARRMLEGYLALPYALYLQRNSAEMVRNLTDSVHRVFERVMMSAMIMVTEVLIVVGIVAVLMATAPWPTLIAVAVLFSLLGLLLKLTRNLLTRWGRLEHNLKRESLQSLQQTLGGLKEIRVLGRESFFYERFCGLQEALAGVVCLYETFLGLPRLLIETIFVFGMLLVLLLITARGGATQDVVPVLGLCAYGGFRVVPSINRMLMALNSIRFGGAAVDHLHDDLKLFERLGLRGPSAAEAEALPFTDAIVLDRVRYRYEGGKGPALEDLSFAVRRGESVGIVGATGAGKSTLINIILALLRPESGRVTVDGVDIFAEPRRWQHKIGYVPQEIYLIDDTLRRNIALGRKDEEIDEEKLRAAVRMAQLEDFVAALPLGFDTMVGERGVRLSGGERQRVAIARALYHGPELLIFDEATSALDYQTERELSRAIETLQGDKTLILIAHRMSTVRKCARLLFLQNGRIEGEGTFDQLLETNREFRGMVSRYEADEVAVAGGPANRL
ncbi:MAG TPA: ABC transporter ATP-binding protein [Candidatus Binatia bacterium]